MTETMDNPKTVAQTRWDRSVPSEYVADSNLQVDEKSGLVLPKAAQEREWKELPIRLTLEKNKFYGVDLFVDYVSVEIAPGGAAIDIEYGVAELFNSRQMREVEEQALEYEIEALLDSEVIPDEEEDEHGKMVKLTDEERRGKAEDLAEQSELEYGSGALRDLMSAISNDEKLPHMFRNELDDIWSDEDRYGPRSGDKPENEIELLQPGEEEFLDIVREGRRKIVVEKGEVPETLKSYALAVTEIMERLDRQDFVETFRKIIPVWSYMRLKYELKQKDNKGKMGAHELQEHKDRLDQMRYWLRSHKLEMAEAARRMLDKKEAAGITPKAEKKGAKQLTVEMKKAKMKPRANPETYTEKLLEYYNALGQDTEIPIDWLIAEGATPDQIYAAADELLKTGRIDPPDYWAITATLSGVDYHVVVPRGNPTANEELAQSKKLEKAAREKHGSLPDKVDKLFRQLKVRFKGKSDSELLDMAKEQLGVKKRQNPSFKNAREALKDALKRITTIEVVEYKPYEPPAVEPTTEESIESLEQTAKGLIEEEEGIEEGVKALESLTAQTIKDDWTVMFDRERKEHPTLSEETVKRIVDDHLAFKKGLATLAPKDGIEGRENPRVEEAAAEAFWERKAKLGPKAIPMGEQMPRRKGEPPQKAEERRDEVRVYGEPGLADDPEVVCYYLWGNLIARLADNEQDHKTLSLSSAGFETQLTNNRLHSILSEGRKHYPILKKFGVSMERGTMWLEKETRLRKPDPKKSWMTHRWEHVVLLSETMYPLDEVKGKIPRYTTTIDLETTVKENVDRLTGKALKQEISEIEIPIDTLEEVQTAIDAVEKSIAEYRAANNDFDSTPVEVAEKLGTRQKFEELLKHRDELMWRGNPKIPYTPPDAPDVEVKCPVTGKYTWSCTRCALFDGRSEQFIECKAKEGKRYYLAKARDKRGTVWDTYVLPRDQRKAGIETRAMGGD